MKYIKLALCLMLILVAGASALAADQATPPQGSDADKVVIRTSVDTKEMREYKLESSIKGRMPVPDMKDPLLLDLLVQYKFRHSYAQRDGDGLLPLDISLLEGQITAQEEKLSITPGMYPRLTVLIDRNWKIDGVFGASKEQLAKSLPGINYNNLIILFYLHDGDKPHAVGDKWESKVKLPGYGDTYNFTTTLVSLEEIDGVKVAKVLQNISWTVNGSDNKQIATAEATADSFFAVTNGKLIKSHIECRVAFDSVTTDSADSKENTANSQPEGRGNKVNTRIDISLVK